MSPDRSRRLEDAERRVQSRREPRSVLDVEPPGDDAPLHIRASYELQVLIESYNNGLPDVPGNSHPARIRIGAMKRAQAAEPERYRRLLSESQMRGDDVEDDTLDDGED